MTINTILLCMFRYSNCASCLGNAFYGKKKQKFQGQVPVWVYLLHLVAMSNLLSSETFLSIFLSLKVQTSYFVEQGCPTFWHLWATLEGEELS